MLAYIISSAEGGIRKHFFDLLDTSSFARAECSLIIYPKNQLDRQFEQQMGGLARSYPSTVLSIAKRPNLADLFNSFKVAMAVRKHNIEVLHAHGAKAGLYARLAKILRPSLRVIYSPHGGAFHKENQGRLSFIIMLLERLLSKLTDVAVFESNFARDLFLEQVPFDRAKTRTIYNRTSVANREGIEISAAIYNARLNGSLVVSVVGRLRHLKGQDVAISSIQSLSTPSVLFLVGAAELEYKADLVKIADPEKVIFWGDEANVSGFYNLSDVILVPSRAESFGYVPLEALLCGAKVVVSDIPAFRETLEGLPNVWFFDCGEPTSLSTALLKAVRTPKVVLNETEIARITNERFGYDFDCMYKEVCA